MYLFAHVSPAISPLAEELVCVCLSLSQSEERTVSPSSGVSSIQLLVFSSVVLLLENTSSGAKSEPELSRKLKSALERHCERTKGSFLKPALGVISN